MLATLLAGHASEDLIFQERTTGPHSDIKRSTDYARKMVTEYGMSDRLGPRTFGDRQEMIFLGREISEQKDYSERFALEIDREVDLLIKGGYQVAKDLLAGNKDKLVELAELLLERETLDGDELDALFEKKKSRAKPPKPPEAKPVPVVATAETPEAPVRKSRARKAPVVRPAFPEPIPGSD